MALRRRRGDEDWDANVRVDREMARGRRKVGMVGVDAILTALKGIYSDSVGLSCSLSEVRTAQIDRKVRDGPTLMTKHGIFSAQTAVPEEPRVCRNATTIMV